MATRGRVNKSFQKQRKKSTPITHHPELTAIGPHQATPVSGFRLDTELSPAADLYSPVANPSSPHKQQELRDRCCAVRYPIASSSRTARPRSSTRPHRGRERASASARETRQPSGDGLMEYDWLEPDEAHGLADGGLAGWPALHVASRDAGPPRSRPRRDGWRRGATEAWARWGGPADGATRATVPRRSPARVRAAAPVHAPSPTKRALFCCPSSRILRSVRGAGVGAKSE